MIRTPSIIILPVIVIAIVIAIRIPSILLVVDHRHQCEEEEEDHHRCAEADEVDGFRPPPIITNRMTMAMAAVAVVVAGNVPGMMAVTREEGGVDREKDFPFLYIHRYFTFPPTLTWTLKNVKNLTSWRHCCRPARARHC
jgi:hypothetical protein